MAKNKTTRTDGDVTAFVQAIPDEKKRKDSLQLIEMMTAITREQPYLYGPSIIGFGTYHYKYETGREGDAPLAGFSPRKSAITVYIESSFPGREDLLQQLGKHKATVSCVYVNKLDDIDLGVLKKLVTASVKFTSKRYPAHS